MPRSRPPASERTALLGLGANLGDRAGNLARALRELAAYADLRIVAVSSLYATEPVGLPGEPEFLNAVAELEAGCDPEELLRRCLAIERGLGRVRSGRTASRPIDLDLLAFGNLRQDGPDLILPHPRMAERAFVLLPLAEIRPEFPIAGQSAAAVAGRIGSPGIRRLDVPGWPPEIR